MSDINTVRSSGVLSVELNRPAKKNAITAAMYTTLAGIFRDAAADSGVRVVLWHGAGGSFSAGNDVEDFLKNPPGPGESPQAHLMDAFIGFEKPIVAAVQGAAIGGGTTMLTHCDFVYAGESAKFQMPFVNLGLVPEFGSSFSVPARSRTSQGCGIDLVGRAFRRSEGRGTRPRDPRGAGPGSDGDRHRNSAEAGGKAECRAASLQAAHKAGFDWPASRGCESRKPGIRRAAALGRRQGSVLGFPGEASAQFREDSDARRGRIGPCPCQ